MSRTHANREIDRETDGRTWRTSFLYATMQTRLLQHANTRAIIKYYVPFITMAECPCITVLKISPALYCPPVNPTFCKRSNYVNEILIVTLFLLFRSVYC
jgi:hypothetical protein